MDAFARDRTCGRVRRRDPEVFQESIVRDVLTRVVPDTFGCISFRPVGRELEDFHVLAVSSEPLLGFSLGGVRGVVVNEVEAMAAAVEVGHDDLFQESQVGFPWPDSELRKTRGPE